VVDLKKDNAEFKMKIAILKEDNVALKKELSILKTLLLVSNSTLSSVSATVVKVEVDVKSLLQNNQDGGDESQEEEVPTLDSTLGMVNKIGDYGMVQMYFVEPSYF
jgi:hypothetical protein